MNILTQKLPTKIKVNDNIYDINYDYKTILNIILAFEDEDLFYEEQLYVLIHALYKQKIPECDLEEAVIKGIKFIDCGEESKDDKQIKKPRLYSFSKDGNYIFSGINQTHHTDIEEKENLHWWKFMSFFMDMSTDCMFGELMYYRTRKQEGKLTEEEKKNYRKIKDIVELEPTKKVESKARKEFFEEFHKTKK